MFEIHIRKTFDAVDWDFLRAVMEEFSANVNMKIKGYFLEDWDLRQGDPLSPHFFGICMEVLARGLNLATAIKEFSSHPKCARL